MFSIYQTKRLHLFPMSSYFSPELHALHSDKTVMASVGGIYTQETSLKKIQESEAHWLRHGFGLWCWLLKETYEFVGRGGLRRQSLDDGQEVVEIAYMLHSKFWNNGLATEIAQYSLEVGQKQFGFDEIIALAAPSNIASQKVMQKIGLSFDDQTVLFRETQYLIARNKL